MVRFDWDEANLAHIALHRVTREEAEEVLGGATFELDTYEIDGDDRVEELGAPPEGVSSRQLAWFGTA